MKVCTRCKQEKSLDQFGKSRHARDGLTFWCKTCQSEAKKEYLSDPQKRIEHNEKNLAYMRKRRASDPDFVERSNKASLERNKRKYWDDPEKARRYKRENQKRLLENPDYRKQSNYKQAQATRKRRSTPEGRAKYNEWQNARREERRKDPEYLAMRAFHQRKRLALQKTNGGDFTYEQWRILCNLAGNKCLSCGQQAELQLDHIIPVIKGGKSDIQNLQPLCGPCNVRKNTDTIDYRTPAILEWLESEKNGKTAITQV